MSLEAVKKFIREVAGGDADKMIDQLESIEDVSGVGMFILGGDDEAPEKDVGEALDLVPASDVKKRYIRIALANYVVAMINGDSEIEDAIYFKKDYLDSLKLN